MATATAAQLVTDGGSASAANPPLQITLWKPKSGGGFEPVDPASLGGGVKTVAGVAPDTAGNVPLTHAALGPVQIADLGFDPETQAEFDAAQVTISAAIARRLDAGLPTPVLLDDFARANTAKGTLGAPTTGTWNAPTGAGGSDARVLGGRAVLDGAAIGAYFPAPLGVTPGHLRAIGKLGSGFALICSADTPFSVSTPHFIHALINSTGTAITTWQPGANNVICEAHSGITTFEPGVSALPTDVDLRIDLWIDVPSNTLHLEIHRVDTGARLQVVDAYDPLVSTLAGSTGVWQITTGGSLAGVGAWPRAEQETNSGPVKFQGGLAGVIGVPKRMPGYFRRVGVNTYAPGADLDVRQAIGSSIFATGLRVKGNTDSPGHASALVEATGGYQAAIVLSATGYSHRLWNAADGSLRLTMNTYGTTVGPEVYKCDYYSNHTWMGKLYLPRASGATQATTPLSVGAAPADADGVDGQLHLLPDGSFLKRTSGAWAATAPSAARASITKTTATLAAGTSETGTVALGRSFRAMQVVTNRPARVRLYATAAQRTADASRAFGTAPTGNHGVLLDVLTATGALTQVLAPQVFGSNLESTPTADIPYSITNGDSAAGVVTATFTYAVTEA